MFPRQKKMFPIPECIHFVILTVIFLLIGLQGAAGFFVKHIETGMCINDTSIIESQGSSWGNLSFVEFSDNCLDPAAQFRFRQNGAMLNLKRRGCLTPYIKTGSGGFYLNMFYIYVDGIALDRSACAQKPDKRIYRAIKQTTWGGLSVYYKDIPTSPFQMWCAVNGHHRYLDYSKGIDPYVKLTTSCADAPNKRFNFGSVTCYGNIIKNANCPKDQYMVVKKAYYRGLTSTGKCGLSDDYSCEVDVTCLVKEQCSGQHECNVTVDDNLFPANLCQGLPRYLYFEYQCKDSPTPNLCPLLPDKPTNVTVTIKMSRRAEIFWQYPQEANDANHTRFLIQLRQGNALILNTTTDKANKYEINNLTPYTTYEVTVAAGNKNGFGDGVIKSFLTPEEAPEGPPVNVQVTAESSSSLSVKWEEPEKDKRNGIIVNYTVCISLGESKSFCFQKYTTKAKMFVIGNLNASTKYYVRVLASTKVGSGNYSESKEKFTNGIQPVTAAGTENTLIFTLQIPLGKFSHFYVVVLKLKDSKQPTSPPDSYKNDELVTYAEATESTNSKPYVAAVIASERIDENIFVLGDGRNTSYAKSRKRMRKSTLSDCYNGPLEPGTSYSVFQRILINNEGDYYSTDWSFASQTKEYTGGPHVLINITSSDIKAKEGDLVSLLCSAQGEPPVTFNWKKDQKQLKSFNWERDQKPLKSFMVEKNSRRSSLLVVKVKDQKGFGEYTCHIQDRFQSKAHTIVIEKSTDDGEIYLIITGIIVFIILLIISFIIIAYLVNRLRRLESSKKNPQSVNMTQITSTNADENTQNGDANYEEVENEQATYAALEGREDDDHLYAHLNEVQSDYVIPKETAGIEGGSDTD